MMPRMTRRTTTEQKSPAEAMRTAIAALSRKLDAAPPEQCATLATKLAALTKDLRAEEQRLKDDREDEEESEALCAEFSREIERTIRARTKERVEDILIALRLDPALATQELQDAVHERHYRI